MKRCLCLVLSVMLILSFMTVTSSAFTMYAPDGRTIDVPESDVVLWQEVGWYTAPVVTIYAPDGRAANVDVNEKELYLNWGWYDIPVHYIYAPDGRCVVVRSEEVEAYKAVGWYDEPVTTMYALDGRIIVVFEHEVEAYKNVGWFTEPVTFMYDSAGRSVLAYRSAIEKFKEAGWYELPSAYSDKIREYKKAVSLDEESFNALDMDDSSINSLMVKYTISYGGSIEYTLHDVDNNGVFELIFSKDGKLIDIYTLNGDNLIKLYENCYFGDRSRLHILSDGGLLSEGSNGASTSSYKLHAISGSGLALVKKSFGYYDGTGKKDYMDGFEYLSQKEFQKRLDKYLGMSIYDSFHWNQLFD